MKSNVKVDCSQRPQMASHPVLVYLLCVSWKKVSIFQLALGGSGKAPVRRECTIICEGLQQEISENLETTCVLSQVGGACCGVSRPLGNRSTPVGVCLQQIPGQNVAQRCPQKTALTTKRTTSSDR